MFWICKTFSQIRETQRTLIQNRVTSQTFFIETNVKFLYFLGKSGLNESKSPHNILILDDLILFFPFSIYSNKYWRYAHKPTYQNYLQILKNSILAEISTCRRNFDQNILPKISILPIFGIIFAKMCVFFDFEAKYRVKMLFMLNQATSELKCTIWKVPWR